MLEEFLRRLCDELSLPAVSKEKGISVFLFGKEKVSIKDLNPGLSLQAPITVCPSQKREELFIELMRGNLLGQKTGGARLGLESDEKTLTLSLGLPYELSYQAFRDAIEEFINYLIYWREEIEKLNND